MHPAHIPLHAESQPADVGGTGDHGPGSGLLGHRLDVRVVLVDGRVELAQEIDHLQVLSAAVLVGNPLTSLTRVVAVEHGSHRIDTEAVGVVAVEPEESTAQQEAADLVPAVVEDVAAPIRMKTLSRVLVLEEMGTVEESEAMGIGREMRRHPVQDDAYAPLVEMVDAVHEVLGRAVAARGLEVSRRLVSPGAEERMLHDGQEFHVGETHLLDVVGQPLRQLPVAERPVAFPSQPHPGADVQLVDQEGSIQRVAAPTRGHPLLVPPVVVQIPDHGSCLGRDLAVEGEGIGLLQGLATAARHQVLVEGSRFDAGHVGFPDA